LTFPCGYLPAMIPMLPHITVCVCAFKRPDLLARLLEALDRQTTEGLFTYSTVVSDNDVDQSAQTVVSGFSSATEMRVTYCVEPQQNIALARNMALKHAKGDFIAFIDDDEVPDEDWLLLLFRACMFFKSDGILGPVEPYFEGEPPGWVTKGRFFQRPNHSTGYKLRWAECNTGNVLFRRYVLDGVEEPFRRQFDTAGEDTDFFRRLAERGCSFVWCSEAAVHELVPPARCQRMFLLKRALLRGSNFPKQGGGRWKNLTRSVIAVPCYTLALPVLFVCAGHLGFKYFVKLCEHASRLLACAGWSVVTER